MVKAKKFQPLAALNQKIKGLEVFESNEERRTSSAPRPDSRSAHASPEPSAPRPVEPEELVTREHWQRYTRDDSCSDPMCGRRLGAANGNVNCRKCGKLFCDEHTLYQMKLSRSAQHEPVRGCWCRVCETCFKSRPGYSDHNGRVEHAVSVKEVTNTEQALHRITWTCSPRLARRLWISPIWR